METQLNRNYANQKWPYMNLKITSKMKIKIYLLLFSLLITSAQICAQSWPTDGMQGDGSQANPYQITTVDQLAAFASYINAKNGNATRGKYYKLMNDLDLSGWDSGDTKGWIPIGNFEGNEYKGCFQGNFDGNNHIIKNLTINRPTDHNVGLFGYINEGAIITNLGIVGGSVKGKDAVGGLAGCSERSTVANCYNTGSVFAEEIRAGGLVGYNYDASTTRNCYTTGSVSVNDDLLGGLVGINYKSTISNCYATGSLLLVDGTSNAIAGGLVGANNVAPAVVENCVAANVSVAAVQTIVSINRMVGSSINSTLRSNYALINMVLENGGVTIDRTSTDSASVNGADKTLADLQSYAFYSSASNWHGGQGWDVSASPDVTKVWQIWDGKSLPYFSWQSSPVYNAIYFENKILFELRNATEKVEVYKNGTLLTTSGTLASGNVSVDGLTLAETDMVTLMVYENGKSASYPVTAKKLATLKLSDKETIYTGLPQGVDSVKVKSAFGNTEIGENNWVTYRYFLNGAEQSGQPGKAGIYKVVGYFAGNNEYAACQSDSVTLTINKKELTVSYFAIGNKEYDGTTTATVLDWGTLNNMITGDVVSINQTGVTATFSDKNVGSGKTVTLSTLSLTGADAGNYTLTQPVTTASIIVKDIYPSGFYIANKTYDGTTAATVGNWGTLNKVTGDDANIDQTGVTATFNDKNMGSKEVTLSTLSLTGTDADNYALRQPTGLGANITPKTLTVIAESLTKTYDGIPYMGSYTVAGLAAGDTENDVISGTATYMGTAVGAVNAGTYTLEVFGLGVNGYNYSLGFANGTLVIDPKNITVSGLTIANKEYDGNTTATIANWGTLQGVEGADNVSIYPYGITANFNDRNAGTGKTVTLPPLSLSGPAAMNYTLTQPTGLTADITAKALTATGFSIMNKVYDATAAATVGNWGTLNKVSGDDVSINQTGVTATFSDKNVGNGKTVTLSTLSLTGTDAANYTLTQPAGLTADITPKTLTATTIGNFDKEYDGAATATPSDAYTLTSADIIGSDDVALNSAISFAFDTKNAGTDKPVSATNWTLTGTDAGNYALAAFSATGNITPKELTVSYFAIGNKEYDGTATATVLDWGTLNNMITGDVVSINQTGVTATFSDKNVGSGKTVTLSVLSLTGADAANYTLTQPTGLTADITAKTLTVTGIAIANKVYDGTATATVGNWGTLNKVTGDDVNINQTGVTATFSDMNVGSGKTVTLSALSLTGADAGNYTLTQPSGLTADITAKAPLTYGVSIGTFTGGGVSADKTDYATGNTVTLTIAPAAGYELNVISAYKTGDAVTIVTLNGSGNTRTFTMPAYGVTVTATFQKTQATLDAEAVAAAKAAIESVSGWTVAQATANTEAAVKTWLATQINALSGMSGTGITVEAANITLSGFTAAVAGASLETPAGTNGAFNFTVLLIKGSSSTTTASKAGTITATSYVLLAHAVTITPSSNGTVTPSAANPTEGSTVTLTITPASGYELNTISACKTGDAATIVTLSGSGNTCTFTMPAYGVTVTATFKKTQATLDAEAVAAAKAAIEGGTYRIAQATGNDAASVKTWLLHTLNVLFGQTHNVQLRSATDPIAGDVTITALTPAVAGTESTPNGANGSFRFTVTLTKGATTLTSEAPGVIVATPYAATPVKRIELLLLGELTARILNTGNVATGELTLALSGANADVFTLPAPTVSSLAVGGETGITLIPRADLAQGIYTATLTVSAEGIAPVQITIEYHVTLTGIDDVPQTKALKAWTRNGKLYVSGLTAGKLWSVYSLSGTPVHQDKATGEETNVSLTAQGMYIVVSEGRSVKVLY